LPIEREIIYLFGFEMSGFDENMVREYFELHGFMIRQQRQFVAQSRKKLASETVDFEVFNKAYQGAERNPNFLICASELPYIEKAIIGIRGWHNTQRFNPKMVKNSAEILKFLDKNLQKSKEPIFSEPVTKLAQEENWLKILVLPSLPTSDPHRTECVELLKSHGVEGIISFRTMLLDVVQKIEVNKHYEKSEFMEILRLLKNYDLVKEPQLGLFGD